MIISEADIDLLGQFIINELAKEIIKQEHKNTGKLIASLDFTSKQGTDSASLIITMEDYGKFVNQGRRKGAAKVPIPALVEWIKQKGIATNNKKVLGIAFAIQKTIEKEGIPTINSRKRGKRVGFVDDVVERIEKEVARRIEKSTTELIEVQVRNLVKII